MMRIFSSVNWIVGFLALGAAIVYPLYTDSVMRSVRAEVEGAVDTIVRGQRVFFDVRNEFVYFRANQGEALRTALSEMRLGPTLDHPVPGFWFEALSDRTHVLIIRAFPTDDALRDGRLPPMLYRFAVREAGEVPVKSGAVKGEWLPLSGQKTGLLSLIGL